MQNDNLTAEVDHHVELVTKSLSLINKQNQKVVSSITTQLADLLSTIESADPDSYQTDTSKITGICAQLLSTNLGQNQSLFEKLIVLMHKTRMVEFLPMMYRTIQGDYLVLNLLQLAQAEWTIYQTYGIAVDILQGLCQISPAEYQEGTKGKQTAAIVKNSALYIEKLSEQFPQAWKSQLCLILPHLASPVALRSAIVTGIANVCTSTDYGDISILLERTQDVNYQVRSRALKGLLQCLGNTSIELWPSVAEVGVGRLNDKAELVRVAGMSLIYGMVEGFPFGRDLSAKKWYATLNRLKDKLPPPKQAQADSQGENTEFDVRQFLTENSEEQEEQFEVDQNNKQRQLVAGINALVNGGMSQQMLNPVKLQFLVQCIECVIQFIEQLQLAAVPLFQSLKTGSKAELQRAILLINILNDREVEGEIKKLQWCMLELVTSQYPEIRQLVAEQFYATYLGKYEDQQDGGSEQILRKLIGFFSQCKLGETEILGEIVNQFLTLGLLNAEIIEVVLEKYREFNNQQLYGAMKLFGQLFRPGRVDLDQNSTPILNVIHDIITNIQDLRVIKAAMEVAAKLGIESQTYETREEFAHAVSQILFQQRTQLKLWVPIAQNGIEILLQCLQFDAIQIRKFCDDLLESTQINSYESLSKVVFVMGQIAANSLQNVTTQVSKCQRLQTKQEKSQKDGVVEFERLKTACEEQIFDSVVPTYILELIIKVSKIQQSEQQSSQEQFQQQVQQQSNFMDYLNISLARLMLTCQDVCEQHLPTLLTPLTARTASVKMRKVLLTSLGDIIRQFPNVVEKWAQHNVPQILQDPDESMRKLTLEIIEQLILSDWMKLRGFVAQIAKLLADTSDQIRQRAALFFEQLNQKDDKLLINHIDEILSETINDEQLTQDQFKLIFNAIFKLCDKDQIVVARLVQRLGAVSQPVIKTKRIAFMLSLAKVNVKSAQILVEQLDSYIKRVAIKEVFDVVYGIIRSVKTNCGSDTNQKQTYQDALEKIIEYAEKHEEQDDDEDVNDDDDNNENQVEKTQNSEQFTPNRRVIRKKQQLVFAQETGTNSLKSLSVFEKQQRSDDKENQEELTSRNFVQSGQISNGDQQQQKNQQISEDTNGVRSTISQSDTINQQNGVVNKEGQLNTRNLPQSQCVQNCQQIRSFEQQQQKGQQSNDQNKYAMSEDSGQLELNYELESDDETQDMEIDE